MKYLISYSALLLLLIIACTSEDIANKKNEDTVIKKEEVIDTTFHGYWVLSDFFDEIIENKSLVQQDNQFSRISILLHIESGSFYFIGSLYSNQITHNNEADSITFFPDTDSSGYLYTYNKEKDCIIAQHLSKNKLLKTYSFRRLRPNEKRLVKGSMIKAQNYTYPFSKRVVSFIIDSLLVGIYKPLQQGGKTLILQNISDTASVKGMKGYNQFTIHSYFGTSHPYRPHDAIIFRDTASFDQKVYSWKFKGDTLILTKMKHTHSEYHHEETGPTLYYKKMD